MASQREIRRNNVRAGLFTLGAFALGAVVLVILNSSAMSYLFASHNEYTVVFSLNEGVTGINEGSSVRLGGVECGRVTSVELLGTAATSTTASEPYIDVAIQVRNDIQLWSNAVAVRTPPLLGSQAWINISTVGGPDHETITPTKENGEHAVLLSTSGGRIVATPSDGLLTTFVGSNNASTTESILESLEVFAAFLDSKVIDSFDESVRPTLEDARAIVGNVRGDYTGWSENLTSSLENASETLQMVATLVRDNREHVNAVLANAETISEESLSIVTHLQTETIAKVDQALDTGTAALDSAANALRTIDLEVAAAVPTIRSFLQDALAAAGELKLATIEVRRSPWRLLYTPKPGELANENLFAAARGFTLAASDMRVAAESFQAILTRFPEALEADPSLREEVEVYLAESLKRFQIAQKRLFSVIVGNE